MLLLWKECEIQCSYKTDLNKDKGCIVGKLINPFHATDLFLMKNIKNLSGFMLFPGVIEGD